MSEPVSRAVRKAQGSMRLLRGGTVYLNSCAQSTLRLRVLHGYSIASSRISVSPWRALRVCAKDVFLWRMAGVKCTRSVCHSPEGGNLCGDGVRGCLVFGAGGWSDF